MVANQASDESTIDRQLRALDDRLFLSKEVSERHGRYVYGVLCWTTGDHPPLPVCEWRDASGNPLPLSSGLIDLVKSLRPRDGDVDLLASQKANEERNAQIEREFDAQMEEIAADMLPRIAGRKRTTIPRGTYLARSRSRRRERGESA